MRSLPLAAWFVFSVFLAAPSAEAPGADGRAPEVKKWTGAEAREGLLELADALTTWRAQWRFTGQWRTVTGEKRSPNDEQWLRGPRRESWGRCAVDGLMVRLEIKEPAPQVTGLGHVRAQPAPGTRVLIIKQDWRTGLQCTKDKIERGIRLAQYPVYAESLPFAPPLVAVDAGELRRIWFLEAPKAELLSVTREVQREKGRIVYTIERRTVRQESVIFDRYELDVSGAMPVFLEARFWGGATSPDRPWIRRNEEFVDINGVPVPLRTVSISWHAEEEKVSLRVTELVKWDPGRPDPSEFVMEITEELSWIQGLKADSFPEDGKLDVASLTRDDLDIAANGAAASQLVLRDGKPYGILDETGLHLLVGVKPSGGVEEGAAATDFTLHLWLILIAAIGMLAVAFGIRYARRRRTT